MAEAAMQQDHGRAGLIGYVPDQSTVMVNVTLIICDRQRRGTVRFKPAEVIVVRFHFDLHVWLCRPTPRLTGKARERDSSDSALSVTGALSRADDG